MSSSEGDDLMGGEGTPPSLGVPLPAAADSAILALEDRLRPLGDGQAVQRAAAEALGLWLGAERITFAEVAGNRLRVTFSWSSDALPDSGQPEADLGPVAAARWQGGAAALSDAQPGGDAGALPGVRPSGGGADLEVPVVRDGRLLAVLMVHHSPPRSWDATEIRLAEAVAQRAWASVERTRAEAAMRESEALARAQADELAAIYASAPVGLCVLDREGRYLRINDRLAANNGVSAAEHLGRTIREVLPDLADSVEPMLRRALAGEELRGIEVSGSTPGCPGEPRVWRENFVPLKDPSGRIAGVTISVEEITEERAAERRQAFLLRLEDRLREGSPEEAVAAACEALGQELGAQVVLVSRLDEAGQYATVEGEWRAPGLPSLLGRHRLSDFWKDRAVSLTAGEALVIPDLAADARVGDLASFAALGLAAAIDMPLRRDGRLGGMLFVGETRPRRWTAGEVALVREAADRAWQVAERARALAELRESEARFRQLAESIREVFYVLDIDEGRMSYVSPAFEEVWGRPLAQALAGPGVFLESVHPDDRARVEADAKRLWSGEPISGEYRILRPDGALRHIHDRAALATDPATGRRRAFGLATDVTDRRRVEERLQLATEAAEIGIFDADLRTGEMDWDTRQRTIWGVPQEGRLTDEMFVEGIHPEDRGTMRAAVARALDPAGNRLYRSEYRLAPREGQAQRWIAAAGRAHFEGCRAVRLIGTVQDITERKRAEAAVAQSEARFRTLADTLPALIFVADDRHDNIWVNESFVGYTGLSAEELQGRGWTRAVHPDDLDRATMTIQASWQGVSPHVAETRFRRADGVYRWHLVRGNPIRDDDGYILQWVGAATDIQEMVEAREALAESRRAIERANAELEARVDERTASLARANARLAAEIERREAAQAALVQSQKLEAVGQLTSGIAHDFNNVIAAIAGGFSVIERRTDDPRLLEVARHGAKAAERGGTLVKQLLAFARQQVLEPRACDLQALLKEAEPLIARSIGPRIELVIHCPADLGEVRVDPVQLEAGLINLAVNARDAMEGGGRLVISARPSPPDEQGRPAELGAAPAIALSIADMGSGMSPEVLARVIEPFFTTKPPGRGTGLGLAMVHGFVHQSGGALGIESREGQGTTVTLWLPLAGERVEEPAAAAPAPPAGRSATGGTVLLVDDDPAVRGVMAAQLSDLGYAVLEAGDAAEALAWLGRGAPIDAVLSDVAMPGTDGVTLAAELRRQRPGLPVLFMTGHADRARLVGEVVLDKPFALGDLAMALADRIGPGRGT